MGKWRRRLWSGEWTGLHDEPRSGAPRTIDDALIEAVIVRTLESCPENATHWSSRGMAKASGLSVSTVQRIWRGLRLQPHRLEPFKLSTESNFVAKVRDVVGLYVSPREHAIRRGVYRSVAALGDVAQARALLQVLVDAGSDLRKSSR